jgi:hypothetical protein
VLVLDFAVEAVLVVVLAVVPEIPIVAGFAIGLHAESVAELEVALEELLELPLAFLLLFHP